jgi:hypothetical protein
LQGRKVAMLDAKAASDVGWETAAKRADAIEKLVAARSSRPVPPAGEPT